MYVAIKWLELFIQLLEAYPSFQAIFKQVDNVQCTYVHVIDMAVSLLSPHYLPIHI